MVDYFLWHGIKVFTPYYGKYLSHIIEPPHEKYNQLKNWRAPHVGRSTTSTMHFYFSRNNQRVQVKFPSKAETGESSTENVENNHEAVRKDGKAFSFQV